MLWLPMAAIPSFFFDQSQYTQLFEIQKQLQASQVGIKKSC
jgi:hypothetical protein